MKKVYIIHGWGSSPEEPIHKWLKSELEKKGFRIEVPEMPNPEEPKIEEWIPFLQKLIKTPDENTFFIGHSVGCQAILRYLEKLPKGIKIGGAVFIAPWMHLDEETIKEEGPESVEIARPWIETPINWEKIKLHANKFIAIFSDDDPFVPISDSELFQRNIRAKIIIEKNKGHFSAGDEVREVPSALNSILEISK